MKYILILLTCCLFISPLFAQDFVEDGTLPKNNIKLNLTALVFKNYSVQYERVINKSFAASFSLRFMPTTSLPFKNSILDAVGDGDPDTKEVIEQFRLNGFAITPEFRWYVGKRGYGNGFYIAPFYRYATHESNTLVFDYTDGLGSESSISLGGKLTSNTGGILFGAQWPLGKSLCLDWWILGPHYGRASGNFAGISSKPLTPAEQNDLREELEALDIPFSDKTVVVTSNGASMRLNGPWGGVRSGISIGFRF